MRRYWVDAGQISDTSVEFTGDQLHHLVDVCRLQVGSKFEVIVDGGKAHFVEMTEVNKKNAFAQIKETRELPPIKMPSIHLALSLPKFQKVDLIIEKSVELGVSSIHPFLSDFSFVRSKQKVSENKTSRWQKIVKSATQQSGRGDLMQVNPVCDRSELLQKINPSDQVGCLFLYEGLGSQSLKQALSAWDGQGLQHLWLIVGSEGGFSDEEVKTFSGAGFAPTTMGDQVLRVETACIAAVSMVNFQMKL